MERKPITFGELRAHLETLTPEQLAMPVWWSGDERGGSVLAIEVLQEDYINPSGEGMEPISAVRKFLSEDEAMTPEEVEAEIQSEPVVARRGQTLLLVD